MNTNINIARFLLALLLAIGALGVSTSTALVDKPIKVEYTASGTNTFPDTCEFTFYDDATVWVQEIYFFDQNGVLTRIEGKYIEQDTFYANGKTLGSLPFSFSIHAYFDSSGNLTHFYANGVVVKVPLPDASWYHAAGRVDFMDHPGATSLIVPDKGKAVNLDGFCAALAP